VAIKARTRRIALSFLLAIGTACGSGEDNSARPPATVSPGSTSQVPAPDVSTDTPATGPSLLLPTWTSEQVPSSPDVNGHAGDGVRDTDQGLLGGAYQILVPTFKLASFSEVALKGSVVDVRPAHLNTPTGLWDPPHGVSAKNLHNAFADLLPYTEITVRVLEVLGSRLDAPTIDENDLLTITVLGGKVDVTVTPEQAAAIGLDPDTDPDTEGPLATSRAEPNQPVSTDLELSLQMAFNVFLAEGDTVVAFLSQNVVRDAYGGHSQDVWFAIAPQGGGVYVQEEDEMSFVPSPNTALVSLDELRSAADDLEKLSGPVSRPTSAEDLSSGGY